MRNIMAIAGKELRSYFASPIAYIVIGFFALLFGFFYYSLMVFFDRQSMQMASMGAPQNVNDQFIRPWPSSPGTSARSTSQIQSELLVTARDWPERRAIGVLSAVAQSAVAAVYSSGLIDCWVRLENTK